MKLRTSPRILRFGAFEVDLRAGELRKQGLKIKLQEQPFQVLVLLIERPGEVVTREEMQKRLWPADTFVDFDHGLNKAINKIREALGDSADRPHFIETLARRGYRFIAAGDSEEKSAAGEPQLEKPIRSIAVMPFSNMGNDPEMQYLCDGMTESIINSLAQLSEVRVMARSTVFCYKARETDPRAVGRDLNVQAVLVGRIVLRGDVLTLGTELVDVRNRWLLWGEHYQRKLSDVLEVQEEIAEVISEKLRLRLTGEEKKRVSKRYTTSGEAYQDYLKGRYHCNKMTREDLAKGIGFFEAAIRKDPNYALAYVGLADAYGLFGFFGAHPPRTVIPRARELAAIALNLDENLAEAHATLGGILKAYDWNWQAAEEEYKRAMELNPNYATAHRLYAGFLAALGRSEEAMKAFHRAQELDPLSVVINMEGAWNLYMAREFEQSVEQSAKTLEIEPHFAPAHFTLGLAYEQMGEYKDAIQALEKTRDGSQGNPATLAGLGHAFAVAGQPGAALKILKELKEISKRTYVSPYALAIVYAGLCDHDRGFESLERAFRERDVWLVWLKREPRFDCLRSDTRFEDLLRRIGFPG